MTPETITLALVAIAALVVLYILAGKVLRLERDVAGAFRGLADGRCSHGYLKHDYLGHREANRKSHLHFDEQLKALDQRVQDQEVTTRCVVDEMNSALRQISEDFEQHVEKCVKGLGTALDLEYVPGRVEVKSNFVPPVWQKAQPKEPAPATSGESVAGVK